MYSYVHVLVHSLLEESEPIRLMLTRKRLLRTHLSTKLITAAWVEEQRLGKGSYVSAQKQKARRIAQILNNIVFPRSKE